MKRSVGVVGVMTGMGVLGSQGRSMSDSASTLIPHRSPSLTVKEQTVLVSVRTSSSVDDTVVEEVEESEGVRQCEILPSLVVARGVGSARCVPLNSIMLGVVEVKSEI